MESCPALYAPEKVPLMIAVGSIPREAFSREAQMRHQESGKFGRTAKQNSRSVWMEQRLTVMMAALSAVDQQGSGVTLHGGILP